MRIPRIYVNQATASKSRLTLSVEQSHYTTRVLRLKKGSTVIVFNGKNESFLGTISDIVKRNEVQVHIDQSLSQNIESSLHIALGQVLSRGERFDWVIQKATELGVSEITALFSERCCVRLPIDKQEKRLDHWKSIAASACEQCGRNQLPVIHTPVSLVQWVANSKTELKYVLDAQSTISLAKDVKPKSVSLLIGPEGGMTPEEISLAQKNQFKVIKFGPRILRTETAPITSIAIMQFLWGDLY